jgi:hypothetical protein
MNEITVHYWHGTKYEDINFNHGAVFPYTVRKRNQIINAVQNAGKSIMLRPSGDSLQIWIDDGMFRQR